VAIQFHDALRVRHSDASFFRVLNAEWPGWASVPAFAFGDAARLPVRTLRALTALLADVRCWTAARSRWGAIGVALAGLAATAARSGVGPDAATPPGPPLIATAAATTKRAAAERATERAATERAATERAATERATAAATTKRAATTLRGPSASAARRLSRAVGCCPHPATSRPFQP
jgi:hypothetical protein